MKTRTITLTGAPPVRIVEAEWEELATAKDERGILVVRRRRLDGRVIVSGKRDSGVGDLIHRFARGGFMASAPNAYEVAGIITSLASTLGLSPELAQKCIERLPPVPVDEAEEVVP